MSYFILQLLQRGYWQLKGRGVIGTAAEIYHYVRRVAYGYLLRTPGVRRKVQKQVQEALTELSNKFSAHDHPQHLTLPKEGLPSETILSELDNLANLDHTRWEDGYVSGAVYHGEDALMQLQTAAFGKFTVANPIHPDVFPGVRQMEAEIVTMVLRLFNAPDTAAGVTTAGGTESILMACLSARQKAYVERGITKPEMYVDRSSPVPCRALPLTYIPTIGSSPAPHMSLSAKPANTSRSRFTPSPAQHRATRQTCAPCPT